MDLPSLWAEGDVASTSSALSAVAAGLALVTTMVNGILSYMSARDKLRFDAEMQGIRSGLLNAQEALEDCEKHRMEDRKRVDELAERTTKAEVLTAKMEGELVVLRARTRHRTREEGGGGS